MTTLEALTRTTEALENIFNEQRGDGTTEWTDEDYKLADLIKDMQEILECEKKGTEWKMSKS